MTHIDPVGIKLIEHFSILIFTDWKNFVIFLQKNMITNYLRAVPFCLSHRNWKLEREEKENKKCNLTAQTFARIYHNRSVSQCPKCVDVVDSCGWIIRL